jgi:broad specificity phosphatase PhoE
MPPTTRSASQPSKLVYVIRHGQAEHNVDDAALLQRDTRLTALGQQQAAALREPVKALGAEVVLSSPILRALQTTEGFLGSSAEVPVVVVPDARERVSHKTHLCEMPVSPPAAFEAHKAYDWTLAEGSFAAADGSVEEWESRMQSEDLAGFLATGRRAARLTSWIESRSESTLVLVSHGVRLTDPKPRACSCAAHCCRPD